MKRSNTSLGMQRSKSGMDGSGSWISNVYERLLAAFGPQHWWPVGHHGISGSRVSAVAKKRATESNPPNRGADAETDTEIVVGAILTQNTAWTNVEQAIENLAGAHALSWTALRSLSPAELAALIRPSGTYRVKAKRLKAFVDYLWDRHGGKLDSFLTGDLETVRTRLLSIHGIGPETADAILLYVGDFPTFVVDAYTKRVLRRHFIIDGRASYDDVRLLFQNSELGIQSSETQSRNSQTVPVFKEYHALLVALGKRHCRSRTHCDGCPLEGLPHDETM